VSLDAMDWVWKYSQAKGVARLVMLAIADKSTGRSCKAFAGMTMLQQYANAGRSTVVGVIREQISSGELELVEGETGPFGAAVYRLPKALGHIRSSASERRGSVQESDRSGDEATAETSADPAPIGELEDGEIGADPAPIQATPDGNIGADSALIPSQRIGSDPAPIGPKAATVIGEDYAPINAMIQMRIGADSGSGSVQILDGIGADSAPQNQEQNLNQKTTTSPAAAVETKPKSARKAADETAPRFDEFYAAYPKRKARPAAEKAWTDAINGGGDAQVLIDAAARYAKERKGQDPHWTPYPATWLNGKRWLDEPDEPYQPQPGAGDYQPYLEGSDGYDLGADHFDDDPRDMR
jgi:hypothetical protein